MNFSVTVFQKSERRPVRIARLRACLLEGVQSGLYSVYQLQPDFFPPQLLLPQTRKLFNQSIVTQHLDPVLEISPSEVELNGSDVDGVEDSQKV